MKTVKKNLPTFLVAGAVLLLVSCGDGGGNGDAGDIQADLDGTDGADAADVPADRDASDTPADRGAADGGDPDAAPDPIDASDATDTQQEEGSTQYEGVQCGNAVVCLAPQICCWHFGTPPTGMCATEEACMMCSSCFTTQKCDGPEDCEGGDICCHIGASVVETIECGLSPECHRVCHTEDDCNDGELCCGTLTNERLLINHCYEGTICPP